MQYYPRDESPFCGDQQGQRGYRDQEIPRILFGLGFSVFPKSKTVSKSGLF